MNYMNILTENCSLQKNEHIDEDKREEKACEREVEYGKQSECFFLCQGSRRSLKSLTFTLHNLRS